MEDDKLYVDLNGAHNCGLFNQPGEVKAEYQYEPWIDVAKAVCIGGSTPACKGLRIYQR